MQMIGPHKQKMPDRKICTGCDVLITRVQWATQQFPEIRAMFFCYHDYFTFGASLIKDYPDTPSWCPVCETKDCSGGQPADRF